MRDHGKIHSKYRRTSKKSSFSTGGQSYDKDYLFFNSVQVQESLCKFSCFNLCNNKVADF